MLPPLVLGPGLPAPAPPRAKKPPPKATSGSHPEHDAEPAEEGSALCCVCLTNQACCMLSCGHSEFCCKCGSEILRKFGKCSLCNVAIDRATHLWNVKLKKK